MGSNPDVIDFFFNLPNPSSRPIAVGSTEPLSETSTRKSFLAGERAASL
jgi:hypothetical protein